MKQVIKQFKCFISLALIVSLMISGCTPASSEKEGAGDVVVQKKLIKVGFSQLGAESDWRRANTASMRETFSEENGYQLFFEDAQQKQTNQAMAIRRFIQQGVDYIVVAPATEVGWDNALSEAKKAEIPVILIDRRISVKDSTLYTCWVGSDFKLEGDKVTGWMRQFFRMKSIDPKSVKIFDLQGTIGTSAQIGRTNGLKDAAKRNGWEIVETADGDFTEAKGNEVTDRVIQEHPEINVIYAENDNMALGAVKAIQKNGRRVGMDMASGEILVVSFDGVSTEAMQMLIDKKIACIGECYPMYGSNVRSCIEVIEAGKKPDKTSFVSEGLYSADKTITQISAGMRDYAVTIVTQDWLDERDITKNKDSE